MVVNTNDLAEQPLLLKSRYIVAKQEDIKG
jgi:hypothetical protein